MFWNPSAIRLAVVLILVGTECESQHAIFVELLPKQFSTVSDDLILWNMPALAVIALLHLFCYVRRERF